MHPIAGGRARASGPRARARGRCGWKVKADPAISGPQFPFRPLGRFQTLAPIKGWLVSKKYDAGLDQTRDPMCANSGQVWPDWARLGLASTKLCRLLPNLGPLRRISGRREPNSAHSKQDWPGSSKVAGNGEKLAGVDKPCAHFDQVGAGVARMAERSPVSTLPRPCPWKRPRKRARRSKAMGTYHAPPGAVNRRPLCRKHPAFMTTPSQDAEPNATQAKGNPPRPPVRECRPLG